MVTHNLELARFKTRDCTVIGHEGAFPAEALPRLVRPVLLADDSEATHSPVHRTGDIGQIQVHGMAGVCLVPPYKVDGDEITGVAAHSSHLESLHQNGHITLFTDQTNVKAYIADHLLLLRDDGRVELMPPDEGATILRGLASEYIREAFQALLNGDTLEAEDIAGKAAVSNPDADEVPFFLVLLRLFSDGYESARQLATDMYPDRATKLLAQSQKFLPELKAEIVIARNSRLHAVMPHVRGMQSVAQVSEVAISNVREAMAKHPGAVDVHRVMHALVDEFDYKTKQLKYGLIGYAGKKMMPCQLRRIDHVAGLLPNQPAELAEAMRHFHSAFRMQLKARWHGFHVIQHGEKAAEGTLRKAYHYLGELPRSWTHNEGVSIDGPIDLHLVEVERGGVVKVFLSSKPKTSKNDPSHGSMDRFAQVVNDSFSRFSEDVVTLSG